MLQPKFIPGRGPNKAREQELAEGAALLRQSLEASQAAHGTTHLDSLISASNLGSALRSLGGERADQAVRDEASALIKEAVEGIADAFAGEMERRPRARDALRAGLADVLEVDGDAGSTASHEASASPLDAAGAFVRSLLSRPAEGEANGAAGKANLSPSSQKGGLRG